MFNWTLDDVEKETRLPIIRQLARKYGIDTGLAFAEMKAAVKTHLEGNSNMATVQTAPRPAPAPPRPAPAPPKAAPAPAAAKPAPAPAAAPKPAPRPAPAPAAVAPKPASAPAKPPVPVKNGVNGHAAPAPKAAVAAGPTLEERIAVLEEAMEQAATTLQVQARTINQLELRVAGGGPYADVDDNGNIVLNTKEADENSLRNWCYMFGFPYEGLTPAQQRAQLAAHAKSGQPFELKHDGPAPLSGTVEETVAADGEAQEITVEDIEKMNPAQLKEIATQAGIDLSACKGNPKMMRSTIINALSQAPVEEQAAELAEGTTVWYSDGENTYEGTFDGVDAEGNYLVTIEGTQYPAPPESISLPQ